VFDLIDLQEKIMAISCNESFFSPHIASNIQGLAPC